MKSLLVRWMTVVSVSILACTAFGASAADEAPAKPGGRVQFESETVDAGDIVRGQMASGTFVVKNVGDETLKVLSAKPGCGCTVTAFDETIAPGQTGTVTASVKTANFSGPIDKTITVTTNDPTKSTATLHIRANVIASVTVLPKPGLSFPSGQDFDYSAKLLLRKDASEKGDLAITGITPSVPWLIAKARKVETREPAVGMIPEALPGDWVLDVSVAEDAPKTMAAETVTFRTGLAREPEVSIPVSAVLETAIHVTPMPLYIPLPSEPAKETSATLSAVLRPGLGKMKLEATASPEPFTVKVEPDGTRRYKATVTYKGTGENSPKEGNVVLRVGEESFTVPVRIGDSRAAQGLRPNRIQPAAPKTP